MDKCIKWYKRISLLSLFLFVFGILLINICIIGLSVGSDNIAYANNTDGTYEDNLITNNYIHNWDYNVTVSSGGVGDEVIVWQDDHIRCTLLGYGSLVGNVLTSTTSWLRLKFYLIGSEFNQTMSCSFGFGVNANSTCKYGYYTTSELSYDMVGYDFVSQRNLSQNWYNKYLFILVPSGNISITLDWVCLQKASYFRGYVSPDYKYYGYNQGYTDGVNSASGGLSDLSGIVWIAPDDLTTSSSIGHYSVNGTYKLTGGNGTIYERPFYALNTYVLASGSDFYHCMDIVCDDWVSPDDSDWESQIYWINPDDVLTFIDGTDIDNSSLITFLSSNGTLAGYPEGYLDGYTDGYQNGYNEGLDIGYQNGYNDGLAYSDYQHGFDDGYTIGVDVGSQFLFSGYHLIDGNYTSGYVTSEFIADGKKYRGTLTRSSGQTNYLDDSVGTSSLIADGVYYAAYKIGSFIDGFAFSTYVGANAYPNNDVDTNLIYFYVIMLDPLYQSYIKVRLVDYSIILNRLRKNLTDYNNYYFKYIFPTSYSYDCYLVYDGYYNDTSIGQYLSSYQLQNFMTYYYDSDTVSDEYNTGVTVGYNEGYLQGNEEGYNSGYADYQSYGEQNYELGYYNGHMIGYQEGLTNGSTNEYGFHTLLGAVFDVPVQTINGLLDFEILGVNMKGFYLGLISLCIALFILKIVFK